MCLNDIFMHAVCTVLPWINTSEPRKFGSVNDINNGKKQKKSV